MKFYYNPDSELLVIPFGHTVLLATKPVGVGLNKAIADLLIKEKTTPEDVEKCHEHELYVQNEENLLKDHPQTPDEPPAPDTQRSAKGG